MAHLITGYAGTEHIKSADDGAFNAAFFGSDQYVMESGNQFEGSIIDNNTIRILDGDLLMYGRHTRIDSNTYEDLKIETGTAGKNRVDLICMTYEKNASNGVEKAYLQVVKGTETEGTAAIPAYTDGNILEGATFNQMPLYKVVMEGVVLKEITALFTVIPTYKTLAEKYAAEFQEKCETHLDSLGVLDTIEEVEANTQDNQLAGALALKEHLADDNPHNITKETVGLGNVPNVSTNDQTPTYADSATLSNVSSGEKLSVAFGKIKVAMGHLITHLQNKSNPHTVTKSQVGLGSVPNVTTNNQTPTYTVASSVAELKSGETLSAALGKLARFVKYGVLLKTQLGSEVISPCCTGKTTTNPYLALKTKDGFICKPFDLKIYANIGAGLGYQIWVEGNLPPLNLVGIVTHLRCGYPQNADNNGSAYFDIDEEGNVSLSNVFLNGSSTGTKSDGTVVDLAETCEWYVTHKEIPVIG